MPNRKELSATQSINYSRRLHSVNTKEDMPTRWHGTPIEDFIAAHNFDKLIRGGEEPRLLIVSCIEYRFSPQIPHTFAYVIRTAGGRLVDAEFPLSYVFAKGVRHIAIIGHNDCGMTKVPIFKPKLVEALVEQGWDEAKATELIEARADKYVMDDEIDSLKREFTTLNETYKNVEIAPLFVSIASTRFHIPRWYMDHLGTSAFKPVE